MNTDKKRDVLGKVMRLSEIDNPGVMWEDLTEETRKSWRKRGDLLSRRLEVSGYEITPISMLSSGDMVEEVAIVEGILKQVKYILADAPGLLNTTADQIVKALHPIIRAHLEKEIEASLKDLSDLIVAAKNLKVPPSEGIIQALEEVWSTLKGK